jgi:hypothetical protein
MLTANAAGCKAESGVAPVQGSSQYSVFTLRASGLQKPLAKKMPALIE